VVRPREILYKYDQLLGEVFFPEQAICSLVRTIEGAGVEIAMIGREGVVGIGAVIGSTNAIGDVVSHTHGGGYVLSIQSFQREMSLRGPFYDLMTWYSQVSLSMAMQAVACNGLHSAVERTGRWLLMMADRAGREDCRVTHDVLATMLAVRRPTVTVIINHLAKRGIVAPFRGGVQIVDRRALEAVSCECYNHSANMRHHNTGPRRY
jgi:CRP-like cAMP-binding protein